MSPAPRARRRRLATLLAGLWLFAWLVVPGLHLADHHHDHVHTAGGTVVVAEAEHEHDAEHGHHHAPAQAEVDGFHPVHVAAGLAHLALATLEPPPPAWPPAPDLATPSPAVPTPSSLPSLPPPRASARGPPGALAAT